MVDNVAYLSQFTYIRVSVKTTQLIIFHDGVVWRRLNIRLGVMCSPKSNRQHASFLSSHAIHVGVNHDIWKRQKKIYE